MNPDLDTGHRTDKWCVKGWGFLNPKDWEFLNTEQQLTGAKLKSINNDPGWNDPSSRADIFPATIWKAFWIMGEFQWPKLNKPSFYIDMFRAQISK